MGAIGSGNKYYKIIKNVIIFLLIFIKELVFYQQLPSYMGILKCFIKKNKNKIFSIYDHLYFIESFFKLVSNIIHF